jgi:hypothetical protein
MTRLSQGKEETIACFNLLIEIQFAAPILPLQCISFTRTGVLRLSECVSSDSHNPSLRAWDELAQFAHVNENFQSIPTRMGRTSSRSVQSIPTRMGRTLALRVRNIRDMLDLRTSFAVHSYQ